MKQCPRHHRDLILGVINEKKTGQCSECKGLWIPGPNIDALLGPGQMLQLRSLCSIIQSDLPCPSGCGQLNEGKIGPVTLDLCQDCGGLWLDPGELETLRQRKGISPHVPVHRERPGQSEANHLLLALTFIPW